MAISMAAVNVSSLTTKHHYSASAFAPSSSTMLLHSSSSQFPRALRSPRIPIQSRPPRTFPLVEAKKQTYSSLDDLLENYDKPVLVDFYATWCGPCQFMVPVLDEVSSSMKDKIQVVKVDTEKYPDIANKYEIQALPTFILFKDGKPCDRFEGALPANQLIQRVKSALER